jgi:hypothetical protein
MINFKSYIAYFKNLAEKHVDIAHDDNGTIRFARLNPEEWLSGMRGNIDIDGKVMILESYEHTAKDLHSDNHLQDYTGAFMILGRAQVDDFDTQDTVIKECEEICIEISKRIYNNSLDYDNRFFLNIEPSQYTFQKVGPLYNNQWFGFRLQFDFTDKYDITVDDNKWSDL